MDMFSQALAQERGSVGARIQMPDGFQRVGANIRYTNGVGARAQAVPEVPEDTVEYSPTEYVAAEMSAWGLGFSTEQIVPAGSIAAPGTLKFKFQPDRPIRPARFVMPSTIISLFVNQVKIGGTPLLPEGAGGIPCEFFSEVSTAPNVKWLTINTTPGVTFDISNPTSSPLLFTGAFYGVALRE